MNTAAHLALLPFASALLAGLLLLRASAH